MLPLFQCQAELYKGAYQYYRDYQSFFETKEYKRFAEFCDPYIKYQYGHSLWSARCRENTVS